MISIMFAAIKDECTSEADEIMDRIKDDILCRLHATTNLTIWSTMSSHPPEMVSDCSQTMHNEKWCLVPRSEPVVEWTEI